MARQLLSVLLLSLSVALLGGCGDGGGAASNNSAIDARAAAERQKLAASFDDVIAAGNKPLALSMGKTLLRRWPDSSEARAIATRVAELEATVAEEKEASRLKNLWVYHRLGDEGDTAFIYRFGDGDADKGGRGIRLVLRDKPSWGRDIFLLTARGRFDCAPDCKVELIVDDRPPMQIDAFASEPNQNPALFFKDTEGFLDILHGARRIEVAAPLQDDPSNRASFEVGGYDEASWLGDAAGKQQPANGD
ncbi:MAG: hypothetical protein H7A20_00310 [Rhodanobacteraceae bacterium]|nr:hypothetical protein [Xanthomonadales bacterium]MCP5477230.1 hypothetical protein [Rhodanobacteraceae bacterium]